MSVGHKRKKSEKNGPKKKAKKEQKNPLERLEKLCQANYFVKLENVENLDKILELVPEIEVILNEKVGKNQFFLAFNSVIDKEKTSESYGVIIGPNTETEPDKIADFYQLWGKNHCKLRRFPDGSTNETVSLNNPSGQLYMPLAKFEHILKVHFPKVQVEFLHFHEDLRFENLKLSEKLKLNRQFVDEFCGKLREICGYGTEMPLRKIEALSQSLYKGQNQSNEVKRIDSKNGEIIEKSKMAPTKLKSVKIELEITQKSKMSPELFARLKMAYSIKLSEMIQNKLNLPIQLKQNGDICIIYQNHAFVLQIKTSSENSKYLMQEKLALIGLHHHSFSGLCQIVQKWLSSQYLAEFGPISDLIIASLSDENSTFQTAENGFLQFLKYLSFTDFAKNFLVLGSKDEIENFAKFHFDFQNKRSKFPPLTIISKLDLESTWTQDLNENYLRRLVNCARMTLHQISQNLKLFQEFSTQTFQVKEDIFDALISLKQFQFFQNK